MVTEFPSHHKLQLPQKEKQQKHFPIIFQLPNLLRYMSNPVLNTKHIGRIDIKNNLKGPRFLTEKDRFHGSADLLHP
jgi:hypothetical protein